MRNLLAWGLLLVGLESSACCFDEPLKHDFGVVPEQLDDGWEIASPASVGLSSEALARIHEVLLREDRFVGSLGLLVIKDGKLVWETYLRARADRDRVHHVQSVTKSVTSIVFGLARDRGYFEGLHQNLGHLFPDEMSGLDPVKRAITLEDLLTMRSGIDFDNLNFNIEMYTFHHDDPLRTILEKPMYAEPGERFYYRNADPQILSYAVHHETGANLSTLAERWLFRPLGINDDYWEGGPDDGVTLAGSGLHLRPRDLAKIGQLLLDGGMWHSERVLSEEWVDLMTSAHVTSGPVDPRDKPFPYGYYWWITPNGVSACGTGGQFLLVVPAEHLVLVHLALPNTSGMDGSALSEFLDLVDELL